MDTIQEKLNQALSEYKGVPVRFVLQQKPEQNAHKLIVEFDVEGSRYTNNKILPIHVSEEQFDDALAELTVWAKTIIKENV